MPAEQDNGIRGYGSIKDTVRLRHEWAGLQYFLDQPFSDYNDAMFEASDIATRFKKIREHLPETHPDLGERAEHVLHAVHKLVHMRQKIQGFPHVPRQDADLIQSWVDTTIKGEELPVLAEAMFPEWASRLDEAKDIPHITQANLWIAQKVGEYLSENGLRYTFTVDAGAGTGKTIRALRSEFRERGITGKIIGVEIAHDLAERAKRNLKRGAVQQAGIRETNIIDFLESNLEVPDHSLDVFTMVYAIHHVSGVDQERLLKLVYRKLKPGGVIAVADPTGRSNFNLTNLLINEPEAVFAAFNKHARAAKEKIRGAGFSIDEGWRKIGDNAIGQPAHTVDMPPGTPLKSREVGDTLYQGLLGYGIFAIKPK
ncbi:class I SAM-dependent methyltransferase [Candidatus Gottesmanbacteria bacterium]|nr:class I SAM-dependent methyltransferase [Candidatus Gottesmanbacteria bacterium]